MPAFLAHVAGGKIQSPSPGVLVNRRLLAAGLVATVIASQGTAQQPQQPAPIRIAASSFATVEVHINSRPIGDQWYEEDAGHTGPARIAISYGQPHARGRKVEGGLIPLDTVWRFGANAATTLHTDVDLTLGSSLAVPRGDYSLFMLYSASGWTLIVNRGTAQWGTDYDAKRDVGRIRLASRTLPETAETLTIQLIPESGRPSSGYAELRGTLKVSWGRTELSAPWSVKR